MILERIDESDLQELMRFRNDPDINEWCRQYLPLGMDDQHKWFKKINSDPSIEMFAIRTEVSDHLIGCCGLTSIDYINSRAEFSLYIAKKWQKMGLGEACLNNLFEIGFHRLNLNLIWGESFDGNPAIDLFKKLGMIEEGIRRQFYFRNGRYIDAYLYSLTREEYHLRFPNSIRPR